MKTQIKDHEKLNLKNSLLENIRLYPESWEYEETLEDYVETLWDYEADYAEERGEDFPSFPEYLLLHIELLHKLYKEGETPENFSFTLKNELRRFENGQYEGAQDDRIEYEASDGEIYDIIYAENPNYEEETEAGIESSPMLWAVAGITADGLQWERDDFKNLFSAIDDLEVYLQES